MKIQYRDSAVFLDGPPPDKWIDGELVKDATAIQHEDGSYLSVQPNGSFEHRPEVGPWETCHLSLGNNTVTYDATGISYLIPIRGR